METIGEKLKSARTAKKLSIKDVVKQTNINPLYLNALEDEDFDKFPSETYLIGFLRSYSEFLKLDSEEIIQAYRGYKIGESVTPLEELTKSTKPTISMVLSNVSSKFNNVIFIAIVVISALLIYWGVRTLISSDVDTGGGDTVVKIKDQYKEKSIETKIGNIKNLYLQNNSGFILVYKNEAVQFLVDKTEVVFILKDISGQSVTIEFFPDKQVEKLELDMPRSIRIIKSMRDVTFTLKGLTENRAKILVKLDKKKLIEKKETAVSEINDTVKENVDVIAQNKKNLKIVFEAEFKQKSFIEIYLDGSMKKRGFIPGGSRERWEASEYIQVKIGNAGGIIPRINGKVYVFGKPGQVANKVITWKKDIKNPNLYHIVVNDW